MIYGTSQIKEAIKVGDIRYEVLPECEPYHRFRVKGVHIDLQVGHHVWYMRNRTAVFDMNRDDPRKLFAYHDARKPFHGVPGGKILLPPGVGVLLHSVQAVGSCVPHITTKVDGRSTPARFFTEAHQSAGHGDPGFSWVWVFEVLNNTKNMYLLTVGSYLASIIFSEVRGEVLMYPKQGRYQVESVSQWRPEMMLPRRGNLT